MEDEADNQAAVDPRKPIDKDLPDQTRLSLSEWCAIYNRLKESGSREERDRFALMGHYLDPNTGRPTRSGMDFYDHRIPDDIVPNQLSDVDSVVGIVRGRFPIAAGVVLKYFMLLSTSHTLDANLHLPPIHVQDGQGPDKVVHLHKTPNGRFMEMEPQGLIRIFFPRAERGPSGSNCLTDRKLELLYDLAVRPAAIEELPRELTGSWPGKWANERFRAENIRKSKDESEEAFHGRQVQHTGRDVHSAYLNAFVDRMRALVNETEELSWAKSFFFVCEMRGLKTREGSMHVPPEQPVVNDAGEADEQSPRVRAVGCILDSFHTDEFEAEHWFIDLGINFTVPSPLGGYACPLPALEAHAAILAHVLERDVATCLNWVQGHGGHYERDELAQLKALAGFRFTNPNPDVNGIHYIQFYPSDKAGIYNLNLANNAKRITIWQVLDNWDKVRKHHFQPLLDVFRDSSATHEMYLRLEVRVEFSQYPFVQLRVPDEKARAWMYSADPKHYWGWKLFRLESIYSVLRTWMAYRGTLALGELAEPTSLLVSLVWMANCLVNRPDTGKTMDEIRDASSVCGVSGLPVWPLMAHFLHSLIFTRNKQPRLSSQRTVSIATLLYVCSTKKPAFTETQLHAFIADRGRTDSDSEPDTLEEAGNMARLAYPVAVANKQRNVKVKSRERRDDQFTDVLPEPKRVRRYDSEDEDYEERAQPTARSLLLTDILTDLPVQIFHKHPHQKGHARSWSALENNSPLVTLNLFSSLANLEQAFPSRIMWDHDSERWNSTVKALLPTIAESLKPTQGLHCLQARSSFVDLQRRLPPNEERLRVVEEARQFAHNHWVWLPYGVPKGSLWATGRGNVPKSVTGSVGPLDGGPWIILNPHFV